MSSAATHPISSSVSAKSKVEVVPDVSGVLGARDGNEAALHVPAEDDLCAALAVLLAQLGEDGLLQEGAVSVAQRVPALDCMRSAAKNFLSPAFWRYGWSSVWRTTGLTSQTARLRGLALH